MPEVLAEATNVSRVFGDGDSRVVAVQHASCRIMAGDRIALVGPSGSGKSTLLHILAALDDPTSGTVTWPALGDRESLRPSKISFVFQTESLLAPLTVLENIEVPCLLGGSDAARAHAAHLGRERYNWDVEKKALLASVDRAFAEEPCRR